MRFRVRICVDAWSDVRVALKVTGFFLYYFCSFKYSPLVNLITNCTLKSISTQSKRLNNYYLLLDLNVFIQRAGWMRAGLMRSDFFVEIKHLEYLLQHFWSSMRFCNESIFMEIFIKDCFCPCGRGLTHLHTHKLTQLGPPFPALFWAFLLLPVRFHGLGCTVNSSLYYDYPSRYHLFVQ